MRSHEVHRESWEARSEQTVSQEANFYTEYDLGKGKLYPNARCPWCETSVFFFRDRNGGCAYFDDPGGDWPIHECYRLYLLAKGKIKVGHADLPFLEADEFDDLDLGYPVSIIMDQNGPVFSLQVDDDIQYVRAIFDRSKKYKDRAWINLSNSTHKMELTLIDDNFYATTIAATACKNPDKLDLNGKCKAAKHAIEAIKSVCRRASMTRKSAYQTPFGVIAVGYTGLSPIVCFSIPLDQVDDSYMEFDDEVISFVEGKLFDLMLYLKDKKIIDLSQYHKSRVVAIVEDNLRFMERAGVEFDRQIDLSEFDWVFNHKLRCIPVASVSIVDATSGSRLEFIESSFTVKDALDFEEHYVENQKDISGASMWKRAKFGTAKLGLSDFWHAVHLGLSRLGWNLDQRPSDYYYASRINVIQYVNSKLEDDVPSLLLLLSYSSSTRGICFLYNVADEEVFEPNIRFVRNVTELDGLVRFDANETDHH